MRPPRRYRSASMRRSAPKPKRKNASDAGSSGRKRPRVARSVEPDPGRDVDLDKMAPSVEDEREAGRFARSHEPEDRQPGVLLRVAHADRVRRALDARVREAARGRRDPDQVP